MRALLIGALGVVYGDIGTSPLYAVQACFSGQHGVEPTRDNVLGILSLIIWALLIVISTKYMAFVLRADNHGEGGILSLMTLAIGNPSGKKHTGARPILVLGLLGAALLYGDGVLTPAVSILGAMEGLIVVRPDFETYIIPLALVVLVVLFLIQKNGTAKLGRIFGPIIGLWFLSIGLLGVIAIVREPAVLAAFNPLHAIRYLAEHPGDGLFSMGAVVLVVTGGEALYTDMGHFGRRPIQIDWFLVVLPSLLLNYLGQGALLIEDPDATANPFYALAPRWALFPLIALATAAAIIASQAVISGAFSVTRQAVLLGYLPRMRIVHTSSGAIGQIYVPLANWALMFATIGLILVFKSSTNLASAYGFAATTTMMFTTLLLFVVMCRNWKWNVFLASAVFGTFLVYDAGFFAAAMMKLIDGGWIPAAAAVVIFAVMITWYQGRRILAERFGADEMSLETFVENITQGEHQPVRVRGAAVFMTGNPHGTPRSLGHNIRHNKVIHDKVIALTVLIEEIPHVPLDRRVEVKDIGKGFYRVKAHYGFMESPSVPEILEACKTHGLSIPMFSTSFFLGRENIRITKRTNMSRWRQRLFAFLAHNSQSATDFFNIPPNQVTELGLQVEL